MKHQKSPHGGQVWIEETPDNPGFYWFCTANGDVGIAEVYSVVLADGEPALGVRSTLPPADIDRWGSSLTPPQGISDADGVPND